MPLVFMFKMAVLNREFLDKVIFRIYNSRYCKIVKLMNFKEIDNKRKRVCNEIETYGEKLEMNFNIKEYMASRYLQNGDRNNFYQLLFKYKQENLYSRLYNLNLDFLLFQKLEYIYQNAKTTYIQQMKLLEDVERSERLYLDPKTK